MDNETSLFATGRAGGETGFSNFEVIRYIRGIDPREKVVSLIQENHNCSLRFSQGEIGDTLIIYARKINDDGFVNFLTTSICSNCKRVSEITDPYEISIYNDLSSWKIPERARYKSMLKAIDIGKIDKAKPSPKGQKHDLLLYGLVLINLILTIFIIVRKR